MMFCIIFTSLQRCHLTVFLLWLSRSYCPEHRPQQTCKVSDRLAFYGTANTTCSICMYAVEARCSNDTLRAPCCKNAWYHRTCIQVRHAIEREMFYLTTHSTHFIYGYMASDIWLRTILIVRKETCCHHIGYSYRLTARVLLYAPSHRQDM